MTASASNVYHIPFNSRPVKVVLQLGDAIFHYIHRSVVSYGVTQVTI